MSVKIGVLGRAQLRKMLFTTKINPDALLFVPRDIPQSQPQGSTCGRSDTCTCCMISSAHSPPSVVMFALSDLLSYMPSFTLCVIFTHLLYLDRADHLITSLGPWQLSDIVLCYITALCHGLLTCWNPWLSGFFNELV